MFAITEKSYVGGFWDPHVHHAAQFQICLVITPSTQVTQSLGPIINMSHELAPFS
jgi:hypothetical protein